MALYTGLALFAGAGGLELGLKRALAANGDRYKCVAYVERSIEAAAVLATQMERGGLDKGVIWDDVTTFTGDVVSPFVDNIDIISAGFPCQPVSLSGKREIENDPRWEFPEIIRLVRQIRPGYVFLENVTGLLVGGGFDLVITGLAQSGFNVEWISVQANEVGSPQKRERIFLLAHSQRERGRGWHTGGEHATYAFPPGPAASAEWRDILAQRPDLAPAVESEVRGVADGVSRGMDFTRASKFRILGNAVVPQQAALAFQILKERN